MAEPVRRYRDWCVSEPVRRYRGWCVAEPVRRYRDWCVSEPVRRYRGWCVAEPVRRYREAGVWNPGRTCRRYLDIVNINIEVASKLVIGVLRPVHRYAHPKAIASRKLVTA